MTSFSEDLREKFILVLKGWGFLLLVRLIMILAGFNRRIPVLDEITLPIINWVLAVLSDLGPRIPKLF